MSQTQLFYISDWFLSLKLGLLTTGKGECWWFSESKLRTAAGIHVFDFSPLCIFQSKLRTFSRHLPSPPTSMHLWPSEFIGIHSANFNNLAPFQIGEQCSLSSCISRIFKEEIGHCCPRAIDTNLDAQMWPSWAPDYLSSSYSLLIIGAIHPSIIVYNWGQKAALVRFPNPLYEDLPSQSGILSGHAPKTLRLIMFHLRKQVLRCEIMCLIMFCFVCHFFCPTMFCFVFDSRQEHAAKISYPMMFDMCNKVLQLAQTQCFVLWNYVWRCIW